jgi:sugar (pentulose or hexulose) kinase
LEKYGPSQAFRQRFTQLLRDSFDKSEITTLQALLIMSNALFSRSVCSPENSLSNFKFLGSDTIHSRKHMQTKINEHVGWKFRQRFTQLLRDSFDKSEMTTLQALLIMSNAV